MKKILVIVFLFCFYNSFAKNVFRDKIFISIDSLAGYPNYFNQHWKFKEGDDSARALFSYNDSSWKETAPSLIVTEDSQNQFKGIGWFRLHIVVDSTVIGKPLAMMIKHFGASQIYLDGKLIKSYGKINGADSTEYYNPQELPFIFVIAATGEHVIAVRYANYNALKNYQIYNQPRAGFSLMLGLSDHQISRKDERSTYFSFILMLLSGIFFALCLIHLFLFFYHISDLSNLYFSIFMFCIALFFVIGFISYAVTIPVFEMRSVSLISPLLIIASVSLSGFINTIFEKKKLRFKTIVLLGIIGLLLRMLGVSAYVFVTLALIIGVSLEAVFTIIFGMIKRVKGSHIIGTGILFSVLIFLTFIGMAITSKDGFEINGETLIGKVLILLLALAILSIPISMSLYQAWRFASINKDLAQQLVQVKLLSQKTLEQEQEKQLLLKNRKQELEKEVLLRTAELREEKKKSDDLLLNILPMEIAEELKATGTTTAKDFSEVTVLFTDFKNFTLMSEQLNAQELVNEINYCYSAFDTIITKHGVEKIKTIGDSYMCAGGLPVANKTNSEDILKAAIEIRDFMLAEKQKREAQGKPYFEIRIGCNTGSVVAGIVGIKKFAYDIWGDTVNIASRMESSGEPGKINISGSTYELVKNKFKCEHRGKIEAKNKGMIDMYFVEHSEIKQAEVHV